MSGDIGGYEWGYTCPECEEFFNLSGMMGNAAIINGDEHAYRTRALEPGDTVECPECEHAIELAFLDADRPDNLDRAIELLRRQHYDSVADWLEGSI